MNNWDEIAKQARATARKVGREERRRSRWALFSRGFELLALDADGERHGDGEPDYLLDDEMTGDELRAFAERAKQRGAVAMGIGWGLDASDSREAYDDGDYEPMYEWVDLPNITL